MMIYPDRVVSFESLAKLGLRRLYAIFQQTWVATLVCVLLRAIWIYLPPLVWLADIVGFLVTAGLIILFFSIAIYRIDALFQGKPVSFIEAWHIVVRRILRIYAVCLLLIACVVLLFALGYWLIFLLFHLSGAWAALGFVLLTGLPIVIAFLAFYFTIPLILVDNKPLWYAFYRSIELTQVSWLSVFMLYLGVVFILTLLLPHSRHVHWLLEHHLLVLFDWIVFAILVPLLMGISLLFMRNLERTLDK